MRYTCINIKEEADAMSIRRANKIAITKERAVSFVKGEGGEVKTSSEAE